MQRESACACQGQERVISLGMCLGALASASYFVARSRGSTDSWVLHSRWRGAAQGLMRRLMGDACPTLGRSFKAHGQSERWVVSRDEPESVFRASLKKAVISLDEPGSRRDVQQRESPISTEVHLCILVLDFL